MRNFTVKPAELLLLEEDGEDEAIEQVMRQIFCVISTRPDHY